MVTKNYCTQLDVITIKMRLIENRKYLVIRPYRDYNNNKVVFNKFKFKNHIIYLHISKRFNGGNLDK